MKRLLYIALCSGFALSVTAQPGDDETHTTLKDRFGSFSLGGGAGVTYFRGDMGRNSKEVSDQSVVFLTGDKRFNPFVSAMANLTYGRLGHDDFSLEAPHNNFMSNFFQFDVRVAFHLDNGDVLPDNSRVSSFISVGAGMMFFNPISDRFDAQGNLYNYWSDGSIYDRPEDDPDAENAVQLYRDHDYETTLSDSINFNKNALVIPLSVGVKLRLVNNFEAQLGFTYNMALTDYLDGWKYDGNNDAFLMGTVGLTYHIGKYMGEKVDYSDVDFRAIRIEDSDGDLIDDFSDKCPDTPKEAEVDWDGCPTDFDMDGIPDYLDKEPESAAGAIVNEDGVTMTEEEINNMFDPMNDVEVDVIKSTVGGEGDN